MIRIFKSNIQELSSLFDCECLSSQDELNVLIVYKEKLPIGYLVFSFDIEKEFGFTSNKEYFNFLFSLGIENDSLIALKYIFINENLRNKHYGSELLNSLLSNYKTYSFLIKKPSNCFYFFEKFNFLSTKEFNESSIMLRKYIKPGLCKNISW